MTAPFAAAILLLSLAQGPSSPAISSPIGTGKAGFTGDGGPASDAGLNGPFGLAFDLEGNLYVADTSNHRVRRVDAETGRIVTVAGNGKAGFSGDGGPAIDASLNEPYGLAVDRAGNLYIADRLNRRVRRVAAESGVITTVAGTGENASTGDGGTAQRAALVEPNDVALDGHGRLYIADIGANRVREVDIASWTIHTFAGNGKREDSGDGGPHQLAGLAGPRAVEVGPEGTIYFLEREGNRLRAVSPVDGQIRTLAGSGKKGFSADPTPAAEATFNGPKEMAIDPAGNVYIVDTENHAIRRLDAETGAVTTLAGSGKAGFGDDPAEASFDRPHGIAIAPDGALYIGDTNNHRIRKIAVPPASPRR